MRTLPYALLILTYIVYEAAKGRVRKSLILLAAGSFIISITTALWIGGGL